MSRLTYFTYLINDAILTKQEVKVIGQKPASQSLTGSTFHEIVLVMLIHTSTWQTTSQSSQPSFQGLQSMVPILYCGSTTSPRKNAPSPGYDGISWSRNWHTELRKHHNYATPSCKFLAMTWAHHLRYRISSNRSQQLVLEQYCQTPGFY